MFQAAEVEKMLREVYGDSFASGPNAALTLERVRGERHLIRFCLFSIPPRLLSSSKVC